jgi:hypothetical protein
MFMDVNWAIYEGYLENNFRFIITKTPLQLQKFYYYSLKLHPSTIFLHSFHPHWDTCHSV